MIEKTFVNPATTKQWRIEMDDLTIRTCLMVEKSKKYSVIPALRQKAKQQVP